MLELAAASALAWLSYAEEITMWRGKDVRNGGNTPALLPPLLPTLSPTVCSLSSPPGTLNHPRELLNQPREGRVGCLEMRGDSGVVVVVAARGGKRRSASSESELLRFCC